MFSSFITCVPFLLLVINNPTRISCDFPINKNVSIIQLNDASIDNKFDFSLADATVEENDGFHSYEIEVYKSKTNQNILSFYHAIANKINYKTLEWVSIGAPKLVRTITHKNKTSQMFFHFNREGFYTYVDMLTSNQKKLLAKEIKSKYQFRIKTSQIKNLQLQQFECVAYFVGSNGNKFSIIGKVSNFFKYPLKLSFWLPANTKERIDFESSLKETLEQQSEIDFQCLLGTIETIKKVNHLIIDVNLFNQLNLIERIFGQLFSVYMTRTQIDLLASELYSSLNILEEYEITEFVFKELFIGDFIKQLTAESTDFKQVELDEAIENLSKYSLKVDKNYIKEKSENILKLQNKEDSYHLKTVQNESNTTVLNRFFFKNNVEHLLDETKLYKSQSDALEGLNNSSDFQWGLNEEKIFAKSIKVVKLSKIQFSKKLIFERVKRLFYKREFSKKLTLSTEFNINTLKRFEINTVKSEMDYEG